MQQSTITAITPETVSQDEIIEHEKDIQIGIAKEMDAWNTAFEKFTAQGFGPIEAARMARKRIEKFSTFLRKIGPLFESNKMLNEEIADLYEKRGD